MNSIDEHADTDDTGTMTGIDSSIESSDSLSPATRHYAIGLDEENEEFNRSGLIEKTKEDYRAEKTRSRKFLEGVLLCSYVVGLACVAMYRDSKKKDDQPFEHL